MENTRANRFSIKIETFGKKILALVVCSAAIGGYLSLVSVRFLASKFTDRPTPTNLKWALRLDPWNDTYRNLAGEYYLFAAQSPEVAVPFLDSAIALNPRRARYWLNLAAADHQLGLPGSERTALAKALSVDPTTPEVSWEVANAYVSLNDLQAALQNFRTSMSGDPTLLLAGLNYCWRLHPNADDLLNNVVPNTPEARSQFLELLMSRDEMIAAEKTWERLIQSREPVERRYIFAYFEYLIYHHKFEKANAAWTASADLGELEKYQPSPDNLVVNGDFELPILNAGLDWRYEKSPDIQLSLDSDVSQSGNRTLKFAFDSSGIKDAAVRQLIPVEGSTHYRFSAKFRTENLEGAGGPQFALEDFASGKALYATEDLKSELSWRKTEGEFTTGPGTQMVLLHMQRVPAGNAIRGTLWVDDVRLTPIRNEGMR